MLHILIFFTSSFFFLAVLSFIKNKFNFTNVVQELARNRLLITNRNLSLLTPINIAIFSYINIMTFLCFLLLKKYSIEPIFISIFVIDSFILLSGFLYLVTSYDFRQTKNCIVYDYLPLEEKNNKKYFILSFDYPSNIGYFYAYTFVLTLELSRCDFSQKSSYLYMLLIGLAAALYYTIFIQKYNFNKQKLFLSSQ